MSDTNWHYAQGQTTFGPVSIDTLRELCSRGAVQRGTLVWTDQMPEWAPAETVAGLWPKQGPAGSPGISFVGYQTPQFGDVRYAGFWLRVVAYLIDWIVTAVLGAICGGIAGGIIGAVLAAGGHQTAIAKSATGAGQLLGLLASWLYYAFMESSPRQASLGKMALGLYVTDLTGGRVRFGRATGRFFGKMLSALIVGIGFIMVGFTARKQGLHDMLAGTLVLRR